MVTSQKHLGTIYTIGTSRRQLEEFVGTLKAYSINTVVDVRRFPTSRLEHFRQANLKEALEPEGIQYLWVGAELGGYRSGGYEVYTKSETFQSGIRYIEDLAVQRQVVIVCAERFPWRCHRMLIAKELSRRGWKVVHIIDIDRLWEPRG